MKVLLICNTDGALYVFRNPLIRALVASGHEVVSICPDGDYIDRLQAMGVRTHLVEFGRQSVSPFQNLSLLHKLWHIIRTEKPYAVHSFTHKAVIYGSLAARLARVPRVVGTVTGLGMLFVHNDRRSQMLRAALLAQYRLAMSRRVRILFQNPDDLEEMVELRAVTAEQALLTNGSGIDIDEYGLPDDKLVDRMRAMLASEIHKDVAGKIVVLFPARGVPEKGFLEFYDAARRVEKASPGRYVFIHLGLIDSASGHHFEASTVADFAHEHGVHYLGFKDNIRDYMSASDVVVLPSYYREGVPRSLIEALALGKTLIASDVPGCRETVIDGWNGFLCEPRNASSLTDALLKVDLAMTRRIIPLSRHYCQEKFDVARLNALTFTLYGLEAGE